MSAEESFAQYASEFPSFDSLPDGLLAGAPPDTSPLPSKAGSEDFWDALKQSHETASLVLNGIVSKGLRHV